MSYTLSLKTLCFFLFFCFSAVSLASRAKTVIKRKEKNDYKREEGKIYKEVGGDKKKKVAGIEILIITLMMLIRV